MVHKEPFIINRYMELTDEVQLNAPFSVCRVNNGSHQSIVQIFSLPADSRNEQDEYYKNFQYLASKLEQIKDEPQANIPAITSWGITQTGSFPYIETEFIEGEYIDTVKQKQGVVPLGEIIKLSEQVSRTLAYCHNSSLVHGNITDRNILRKAADGKYILTCFGLSVYPPAYIAQLAKERGRLYAIAPEQTEGTLVFATDIYQFGYVLYALLTGTPFNEVEATIEEFTEQIISLRQASLRQTEEEDVPQWFISMLYKCLQIDWQNRYAGGLELYDHILYHSITGNKNRKPGTLRQTEHTAATTVKTNARQVKAARSRKNAINDITNIRKRRILPLAITVVLLVVLLSAALYVLNKKNATNNDNATNAIPSAQESASPQKVKDSTITVQTTATPNTTNAINTINPIPVIKKNRKSKINTPVIHSSATDSQTARAPVYPWRPEGTTVDEHNGLGGYRVRSKAYFYNEPDESTRRNAFIVHWNNAVLKPIEEKNEFIYIIFTNIWGQTSKGWLRKQDLVKVE